MLLKGPAEKVNSLARQIKEKFIDHYLRVQYHIAQELYTFESYDEFIDYLAEAIIMKTGLDDVKMFCQYRRTLPYTLKMPKDPGMSRSL